MTKITGFLITSFEGCDGGLCHVWEEGPLAKVLL